MLSDPLVVTYNSAVKNLPRSSASPAEERRLLARMTYVTPDREFSVKTERYAEGRSAVRSELVLTRVAPDPDGPFVGSYRELPNSFGIVLVSNINGYNTSVDIPLLRSAVLSLVDPALQSRLIGGEV